MSAMLRLCAPICALGLAAALLPGTAVQAAGPGTTIRVSVATDGSEGEFFGSREPSISSDGRYVVFSSGDQLAADDTNALDDVYLRDTRTGVTELISVGPAGTSVLGDSNLPVVSADGRYVAFISDADLIAGDQWTGGTFLRDRTAGTTTWLGPKGYWFEGPDISADGNFVVFPAVLDFVPQDTNGYRDVYLWQRGAHVASVVSTGADGRTTAGDSTGPAISDDGRYVTYATTSAALNGGVDGNRIVVTDRESLATTVVSPLVDGAAGGVGEPVISGDGKFVAYSQNSARATTDIYLWERATARTTPVSVNVAGRPGTGVSLRPHVSRTGRYVAFWSSARDLVPEATTAPMSVYRYDRRDNRSVLAMTPPDDAFYGSEGCDISDDGFFVATETKSATLVEGDTNGQFDVFRTEVSSPVRAGPAITPTTRPGR